MNRSFLKIFPHASICSVSENREYIRKRLTKTEIELKLAMILPCSIIGLNFGFLGVYLNILNRSSKVEIQLHVFIFNQSFFIDKHNNSFFWKIYHYSTLSYLLRNSIDTTAKLCTEKRTLAVTKWFVLQKTVYRLFFIPGTNYNMSRQEFLWDVN